MKTNTLIFIVLGIIVAAVIGLVVVSNIQAPQSQNTQSEVLAANYVTYTPAALAKAQEKGRTVLFFWAPWCGTCSFLDDELKRRNSELPNDLTVLRVNFDTQSDLKNRYQVITQHTLVQIDKNGNEVTKWIGGGIDALADQIK